jgi:2-keto-4-pentenoate hydratase/2-oxohepta-3-ene-1,7-dioic acid hydratase in catechol pathway
MDPNIPDTATAMSGMSGRQLGSVEPVSASLVCPIVSPTKVIAIGLNYLDHIRETGVARPSQPVVFAKFPNALSGPRDDIVVSKELTREADYEIELAVVMGRACRSVAASQAPQYVFGYAIANDVSPRDLQRTDPQLSWAKSVDGFCPIGPWITTADEVGDPQVLGIKSWVNGEMRQSSTSAQMLFSVGELIEHLSRTMTLLPGDVILTGTPHGVGFTMTPPRFLAEGDVVRGEIDGLGSIENRISA